MNVTLLDTKTGERCQLSDAWDSLVYWWSEGNGSCDCNRQDAFGHDVSGQTSGYCLGCERYLVVDVSGDLEGLTREEAIREANQSYPPELVAKHLGIAP